MPVVYDGDFSTAVQSRLKTEGTRRVAAPIQLSRVAGTQADGRKLEVMAGRKEPPSVDKKGGTQRQRAIKQAGARDQRLGVDNKGRGTKDGGSCKVRRRRLWRVAATIDLSGLACGAKNNFNALGRPHVCRELTSSSNSSRASHRLILKGAMIDEDRSSDENARLAGPGGSSQKRSERGRLEPEVQSLARIHGLQSKEVHKPGSQTAEAFHKL